MSKKISNKELIINLEDLVKKFGRIPKKKDLSLKNGSKYSVNAYKRAFGNFNNSLITAGLKPNQVRNVSKEEIISDLQNVYKKLGHSPTREEYVKLSNIRYSGPTIKKKFGSWVKLFMEANIPITKPKNVTKNDVIRALVKWYKENDKKTSCLEYWTIRKAQDKRKFPFSCNTIKKKFNDAPWEKIMQQIDPSYESRDPYFNKKPSIGKDGNSYLSKFEKKVGDYLFRLKNKNKVDNYKYEELICNNKQWTCDFCVEVNSNKFWIEADGLGKSRKIPYDSGENEKIIYYDKNNFNYTILQYNSNIREEVKKFLCLK